MSESTALAKADNPAPLALAEASLDGAISMERLIARLETIKKVQAAVMTDGVHYGTIPGTPKPTLLKPGAEILCMVFQFDPQFELSEHWSGLHLEIVAKCTLYHAPSGSRLGSGIGSCSTMESKYAYRKGSRACPACGSTTALLKSKRDPEWFCWAKKDGCGETFPLDDERITSQTVDRVANPDLPDQYNTVRKMACKRAHVAAVLFVGCASELFTQDVEDLPGAEQPAPKPANGNGAKPAAKPAPKGGAALPLATIEDFEEQLAKISAAESTDELADLAKAVRGIQFSREQIKVLSEADKEQRAYLADPDSYDRAAQ